jgi:Cof subfamily protein (haloacid dehalogenase superfamily)
MVPGLARLRERFDAILIDLDGTLLDAEAKLTARSAAAVKALERAGLSVILCTGRSLQGTRRFHKDLGLASPLVAFNGAWIGPVEGPPVVRHPIPDDHVPHVTTTEARALFSFRHRGDHKFVAPAPHRHFQQVSTWYENVVHVPGAAHLPSDDLMRVSLFFESRADTEAAWHALPEPVRAKFHRETFALSIFPDFADCPLVLCEVQKAGRGKAAAFDYLRERCGIGAERTVAVGDQSNDLGMLREAGLAVAMENAIPEALALAHVVVGHHARAGLAAWIESGAPFPDAGARGSGAAPAG